MHTVEREKAIRVLLAEPDESRAAATQELIRDTEREYFECERHGTFDQALEAMARRAHDIYLIQSDFGDRSGIELLRLARTRGCVGPIIFLAESHDRASDLAAMESGAADFLIHSEMEGLLERSMRYALAHHRALEALR